MKKILLLEDDDGLRFTLTAALERIGHRHVIGVKSCDEAIKVLRRQKPDLVVLDLVIGAESSIDVANYAQYAAPDADVIYITGSRLFPLGELHTMAQNVRWVLRKPVDLRDLDNIVDHLLEKIPQVA